MGGQYSNTLHAAKVQKRGRSSLFAVQYSAVLAEGTRAECSWFEMLVHSTVLIVWTCIPLDEKAQFMRLWSLACADAMALYYHDYCAVQFILYSTYPCTSQCMPELLFPSAISCIFRPQICQLFPQHVAQLLRFFCRDFPGGQTVEPRLFEPRLSEQIKHTTFCVQNMPNQHPLHWHDYHAHTLLAILYYIVCFDYPNKTDYPKFCWMASAQRCSDNRGSTVLLL